MDSKRSECRSSPTEGLIINAGDSSEIQNEILDRSIYGQVPTKIPDLPTLSEISR